MLRNFKAAHRPGPPICEREPYGTHRRIAGVRAGAATSSPSEAFPFVGYFIQCVWINSRLKGAVDRELGGKFTHMFIYLFIFNIFAEQLIL